MSDKPHEWWIECVHVIEYPAYEYALTSSHKLLEQLNAERAKSVKLIEAIKEARNHAGWICAQDNLSESQACAWKVMEVINAVLKELKEEKT